MLNYKSIRLTKYVTYILNYESMRLIVAQYGLVNIEIQRYGPEIKWRQYIKNIGTEYEYKTKKGKREQRPQKINIRVTDSICTWK